MLGVIAAQLVHHLEIGGDLCHAQIATQLFSRLLMERARIVDEGAWSDIRWS